MSDEKQDAMAALVRQQLALLGEDQNAAVEKANGNLSQAARLLGMTRPQLAYRLKKRDGD